MYTNTKQTKSLQLSIYVHFNWIRSPSQTNNKEIIKWLFALGLPCLTREFKLGPSDRLQAILALTLRARANNAF